MQSSSVSAEHVIQRDMTGYEPGRRDYITSDAVRASERADVLWSVIGVIGGGVSGDDDESIMPGRTRNYKLPARRRRRRRR